MHDYQVDPGQDVSGAPVRHIGRPKGVEGARIIVTGSSRGIGAATATALVRAGALVVINYRKNFAAALRTMAEIGTGHKGSSIICQADVRKPKDVDRLINTCVEKFGGIDGLVNNAHAEFAPKSFERVSWREMLNQIDGSLKSVYLCTQAALPYLKKSKRASVINMSTVMVTDANSHMSARIAAKGAVEALTRSLAGEYGGDGIRFNALSIGWTRTDQLENVSPDIVRQAAAGTSLGRIAEPSEIADTAVFLLSDAASYITGSVFPIAGGLMPDPR
jgi:NAD(P)-dependent dehydrogenase (short-subunit alcohol dehydrogenase family)